MDAYHQALIKEITAFANVQKEELQTIYIGGGTPSTYPPHLLLDTFAILKESFKIRHNAEISLEVNPGTVTEAKLLAWKKAGINRLSLGVQSLNDKVLKDLNRHQAANDVLQFMEIASPLFDNISVDLILGLPGIPDEEWKRYLQQMVAWPIRHLSMYFLTVHENTPLYFGVKQNRYQMLSDEAMVELYEWSVHFLQEHGFMQYEISNFAQPGFESKHNSVYWQRKPYKGFGLGACSFDGMQRMQNEKNLLAYLKKVEQGELLEIFEEQLTDSQALLEHIMLSMRQSSGLDLAALNRSFALKTEAVVEFVESAISDRLACLRDNKMILTPRGHSLENELVVRLMQIIE